MLSLSPIIHVGFGLLAGVLTSLAWFGRFSPRLTPVCLDLYQGPASPRVYSIKELYHESYGRDGLAHITVAGAMHHGMRNVEVWLQTFAPGVRTPIHRHACEEVFVIQRGGGTAFFRAVDGSMQQVPFKRNNTMVILPDMVHQIVNTGQEDMQALVVFDSPPIQIYTYANWSASDEAAELQLPYYWDRQCPPRLPPPLQQLSQWQQQRHPAQPSSVPADHEL